MVENVVKYPEGVDPKPDMPFEKAVRYGIMQEKKPFFLNSYRFPPVDRDMNQRPCGNGIPKPRILFNHHTWGNIGSLNVANLIQA